MSKISQLDFTKTDAAEGEVQRELFQKNLYVETPLHHLLNKNTKGLHLYVGSKGSGKSALRTSQSRKHLMLTGCSDEIILRRDFATSKFFEAVDKISALTGIQEKEILVRNICRKALGVRLMILTKNNHNIRHAANQKYPSDLQNIQDYLAAEKIEDDYDFQECADDAANEIESYLAKNKSSSVAKWFPNTKRYASAEASLVGIICEVEGYSTTIDELDYTVEVKNFSTTVDFLKGLIFAAHGLSMAIASRQKTKKSYAASIFVPEDLFRKSANTMRDYDKIVANDYEFVVWLSEDLKELLARKIAIDTRSKPDVGKLSKDAVNSYLGRVFEKIGEKGSPKIHDRQGVLRDQIGHILFHSQYNPRELFTVMDQICRVSLERDPDAKYFSSDDIVKGLESSAKTQIRRKTTEYKARIPSLQRIFNVFSRSRHVIFYSEAYDLISLEDHIFEVLPENLQGDAYERSLLINELIYDLFEVGFFGLVEMVGDSQTPCVKYHFAVDNPPISDDSSLMIHPMFWNPLNIDATSNPIRVNRVIEPEWLRRYLPKKKKAASR